MTEITCSQNKFLCINRCSHQLRSGRCILTSMEVHNEGLSRRKVETYHCGRKQGNVRQLKTQLSMNASQNLQTVELNRLSPNHSEGYRPVTMTLGWSRTGPKRLWSSHINYGKCIYQKLLSLFYVKHCSIYHCRLGEIPNQILQMAATAHNFNVVNAIRTLKQFIGMA